VEAPPRDVTKRSVDSHVVQRNAGTRGDALRAIEIMRASRAPRSVRASRSCAARRPARARSSSTAFRCRSCSTSVAHELHESRLVEKLDVTEQLLGALRAAVGA
jgi:hypothetical protein